MAARRNRELEWLARDGVILIAALVLGLLIVRIGRIKAKQAQNAQTTEVRRGG